jgi:hypothetical protein
MTTMSCNWCKARWNMPPNDNSAGFPGSDE